LKLVCRCYNGDYFDEDVDLDLERIYQYRPKLVCPPLLDTLQYNNLPRYLIHHFAATSGSLQLYHEIIYEILIVPEFI